MTTNEDKREPKGGGDVLAMALRRREYERLSWFLLAAVVDAVRTLPPADIEDALAVLSDEDVP